MPKPQPLSSDSEQRIVSALGDVVDLVNDGSTPSAAIAKVAADRDMPLGHAKLMVRGYNTGMTEHRRKTGADVLEKAEEFELADSEKVANLMYPDATDSPALAEKKSSISSEYDYAPVSKRRSVLFEAPILAKVAEVVTPDVIADPHRAVRAFAGVDELKAELATARENLEECRLAKRAADEALSRYFTRDGCRNYHEVKENAEALLGKQATVLLDSAVQMMPFIVKLAGQNKRNGHAVSMTEAPYNLMDDAAQADDYFVAASRQLEKLSAEYQSKARDCLGKLQIDFDEPLHGSVLDQNVSKEAFFGQLVGTAAGTTIGRELAGGVAKSKDSLLEKAKRQLTDPQQEAEIRNIGISSMLNDLMGNDAVISGYPHNEIINHFNEISQLAPRVSNQSGLMRALLRKRLTAGNLDPYEIEQLIKIENGLKKRDTPGYGVMEEGGDGVL